MAEGTQQRARDETLDIASATASTSALVAIRLACQALVLVLSVRVLGAEGFGIIATAVAVSLLLGPWSGAGIDFLALRATARAPERSAEYFSRGLRSIAVTTAFLVPLALVIAPLAFGDKVPLTVLASIVAAELLFLRTSELVAKILQGNDRPQQMAYVRLMNSVIRLIVLVIGVATLAEFAAFHWALLYLLAAFLSAAFAIAVLRHRIDFVASSGSSRGEWGDGAHFAAGVTSARVSNELDKALVLSITGAASAGIYSAGYRLISFAAAPVITFVNVVVGSLYRQHDPSARSTLVTRSLVLCSVAALYGLMIGAALWLLLPWVTRVILGPDFLMLQDAALVFGLLPVAVSCRIVCEQAIAALNRFRIRSTLQWSAAALAVAGNLYWLPIEGWIAAAWVLLAVETFLALAYLITIASSRSQ